MMLFILAGTAMDGGGDVRWKGLALSGHQQD